MDILFSLLNKIQLFQKVNTLEFYNIQNKGTKLMKTTYIAYKFWEDEKNFK